MAYFKCLDELLRKALPSKTSWYGFPFTIIAVLFSVLYFISLPLYMLNDLLTIEMRKELESSNDKVGVLAMAIKYLIAYNIYIFFQLSRIFMLVPMAITYFFIVINLFIGSIGKVKENPFIFHVI